MSYKVNCILWWWFVCLFKVFRPTREFFTHIEGEELQILTNARHSWRLSFSLHTYCDTGHPFIMVISKDPWHSHLLPSVWQWSCHYLFLRPRSVATWVCLCLLAVCLCMLTVCLCMLAVIEFVCLLFACVCLLLTCVYACCLIVSACCLIVYACFVCVCMIFDCICLLFDCVSLLFDFMFVCLDFFFVQLDNYSLIWRRYHSRWRAAVLTLARHSWPLSSEGSLACHTYCDTGLRT